MQELKTTNDLSRVEPGRTDDRDRHRCQASISDREAARLLSGYLNTYLTSWQLNAGVTEDLFQRRPELLRRTFVWSLRQVNNALIM